MNQIRLRLERALNLQNKHEQSTSAVEGTTSNHLKGKSLDHLRLQLSDIESATGRELILALEFQWFWLGRNGERNEMISAKRFSYKNHLLRKWRSIPESRFPKAEHEEIQKLKDIQQVLKSKSKADKFRFSPSNMKVKKDHMTWYSLSRIKRKKDEMLSATNVVYNSSSVAILSRFSGAIEFLPRQPKRDFIDDEKDLHFKMMIINNIIMMNLIPKSTKASTIGHEVTRYARMLESCGVKATYARKDEDVEVQKLHMPERYARIPESCGVKATYARKDEDVKGLGIDDEQGVWFAFVLVEPALTDMENL
ncbi:hypothetical protein L1987_86808 [Smallanthus sonchifolius]|uniref:Uncharacterized protein n=1 Tax=Smallanthus sonchifolius TaxID=185202 RepID=A0ACB8Y0Y5_9ASTR|nr:hypothetical protein L1987_86808 [Smallanthus sonchifolius]